MARFLTSLCRHCQMPVLIFKDICYSCGHMAHVDPKDCRCPPCAESIKADRIYDAIRDAQMLEEGGQCLVCQKPLVQCGHGYSEYVRAKMAGELD